MAAGEVGSDVGEEVVGGMEVNLGIFGSVDAQVLDYAGRLFDGERHYFVPCT